MSNQNGHNTHNHDADDVFDKPGQAPVIREDETTDAMLDQIFATSPEFKLLEGWGLSPRAIAQLLESPEMIQSLMIERHYLPFPAGYTPSKVEIYLDDLLYTRLETVGGEYKTTYLRDCSTQYAPSFVELQFDGQSAMVLVCGECVVNRVQLMANLDQLLGRLQNHLQFSA